MSANTAQGIDQSLSLLKQLQSKLKNRKNKHIKTESFDFNRLHDNTFGILPNEANHIQFPATKQKYPITPPKSPHGHTSIYTHSLPTMVEQNQNEHESIRQIVKENRKLKKYVNCLLQMNDYLKNQLIQKNRWKGQKTGNTFELELMRMEVEYLKELNRDKELELKKTMYMNSETSKKPKKHKKSTSYFAPAHSPEHARSNSVYISPSPYRNDPEGEGDKITKKKKLLHSKKQTKKKKTVISSSNWKKCRLCYI